MWTAKSRFLQGHLGLGGDGKFPFPHLELSPAVPGLLRTAPSAPLHHSSVYKQCNIYWDRGTLTPLAPGLGGDGQGQTCPTGQFLSERNIPRPPAGSRTEPWGAQSAAGGRMSLLLCLMMEDLSQSCRSPLNALITTKCSYHH